MVVNGGQTVQALIDYGWNKALKKKKDDDLKNIFVPVKFVSVESHAEETIKIAEAANSQNPVYIEDLISNDQRLNLCRNT